MATSITVSTAPLRGVSPHRGAPRKVFRGTIRTLIRKTLAKMVAITNADDREATRATNLGYVAALVFASGSAGDRAAATRIIRRLQACLRAKEGDE